MTATGPSSIGLAVVRTGPLATIQDLGRPGLARLGVSPSGAADRGALALGNRLLGNPSGAAGIEITLGGLSVRAVRALVIALTGVDAHADIDGHPVGIHATTVLPAGGTLTLATPSRGLRSYLCVRGGIDGPPALGSRSRDVLAGLGPPPLQVGDRITVGPAGRPPPNTDWAPTPRTDLGIGIGIGIENVLGVHPGPRVDWFTPPALRTLTTAPWTVTGDIDRIGVRLAGPVLERAVTSELPSEGLVRGAIQVPPNGQPLIFLSDHPTTGGYPVIGVVHDVDAVAQLRPGDIVRFALRSGLPMR